MSHIDRHIGRPGLEDRQHRGHRRNRALHQQRDHIARPYPSVGQHPGKPIRGSIELPVRQPLIATHHRNRLRTTPHLNRKQLRYRCPPRPHTRPHPTIPDRIQLSTLGLIEHLNRGQPPLRIRNHRDQHPLEPVDKTADTGVIEHIGREFDTKPEFLARQGLQDEGVVSGFAAGHLGDSQVIAVEQRSGVDRKVFVNE
ncbi:hypothetical protein MSIMFB_05690 [Mycobacterium simulans]|uniref:Uncharacterized protein n=1 Tax=Mycobacterium simulans TaxID=627089 RepID=A0A7Z7IQZ0_9MYCO|nr:hypothetical protein MSIMFB_05690 [Mycobacterium simulans]